jgi:hypothetical protein
MPLRLRSIAQLIVLLQPHVELVQRLVDGFLPQRVLLVGDAGLKGGRGSQRLGEREDLGAQESGFEIDYCGGVACHCGLGRLVLVGVRFGRRDGGARDANGEGQHVMTFEPPSGQKSTALLAFMYQLQLHRFYDICWNNVVEEKILLSKWI